MTQRLNGKRALVTGGSRGIGAAIARKLAADGAGVAITYNGSRAAAADLAAELMLGGGTAFAIQADSADPEAVKRSVEEAAERLGGLDILVLNAGVAEYQDIAEGTIEHYHKIFDVNVQGVYAAVAAASPLLSSGGSVVVTGSVVDHWVPGATMATYAASKGAIRTFVRGWARDFGPRGIRVNVVQPGPVDTDMNPADGEWAKLLAPQIPLGRYGRAEEIANVAAFLASDEASFVTGAAIDVDGGISL